MPNYQGLDVLKYECNLLKAFIKEEEKELDRIIDLKDFYSEDLFSQLVTIHQKSVQNYTDRLQRITIQLDSYQRNHDPEDIHKSEDPLEDVYQDFLKNNLSLILRKIVVCYENCLNRLLSDGIAHFNFSAKKIAAHTLYCHIVDNIVCEYLLNQQVEELSALPCHIKGAASAIKQKYKYFSDRIVCCPEIGTTIQRLLRDS